MAGLIDSAFGIKLFSSIELYGRVDPTGRVLELCVQNCRTNNAADADVAALAQFAAQKQLCLVNWYCAEKVDAEIESFTPFFASPPPETPEVIDEQ